MAAISKLVLKDIPGQIIECITPVVAYQWAYRDYLRTHFEY